MAANGMLQDAEADGFPILDLADYLGDAPGAVGRLAGELRVALETVGFLVVVNHGVPQAMIDDVFAQAARLHALPMAVKQALRMGDARSGTSRRGRMRSKPRRSTPGGSRT